MNEQETKRTIDEVLDVETGEIIEADIFFKKPESRQICDNNAIPAEIQANF